MNYYPIINGFMRGYDMGIPNEQKYTLVPVYSGEPNEDGSYVIIEYRKEYIYQKRSANYEPV